jgi:hypothetical protein
MDFQAEVVNGQIVVKAIVEKVGNNVTVHVPSFPLIQKLKEDFEKKRAIANGIGNI